MNVDFDKALQAFLAHITKSSETRRLADFPSLKSTNYTTMPGKKNIRVVSDMHGSQRSVFCFIRIEDGAVLKAAGWSAPAKHARGTIYTDDPAKYGVGEFGANYLR